MKPAKFEYLSAGTANDAANELTNGFGETKLIAGAQSIGPMLNLRLARPDRLVDVSMLPELREARVTDAGVEFGAAVTHAEIEDGDVPDPTGGWLQAAASNIAHRAVRNRGTLGGSLAHADPAADWIIVMTGLGATVLLDGPAGRREVAMAEFVTGPFETDLKPDELIRAVLVPRPSETAKWGYWKFVRQVGEFAKASATVLIDADKDSGTSPPRIAIGALGRQPLVLDASIAKDFIAARITAAQALSAALPDRTLTELALHIAALNKALSMAQADGQNGGGQA